jgi:hypothetical protein
MSGDPFKHVQSGDRIELHHVSFNAMLDAGRDHLARAGQGAAPPSGFPWGPGLIRVRNTSGANCDRFNILGLSAITISPNENLESFQTTPAIDGVGPNRDSHTGKFGILLKPLPQNTIGPAIIAGVTVCQVEVVEEIHQFADVGTSSTRTQLTSGWVGAAEILWKEEGTGVKWAIVRIGTTSVVTYLGKADATFYKGGSGTISILDGFFTDTGVNMTGCVNTTGTIQVGRYVTVTHMRGKSGQRWTPFVAPLEC